MREGDIRLGDLLASKGLSYGPVYATGLLKGHEAARMVADFRAQQTIRSMTARILRETEGDDNAG